jgi:hypothetical protein
LILSIVNAHGARALLTFDAGLLKLEDCEKP